VTAIFARPDYDDGAGAAIAPGRDLRTNVIGYRDEWMTNVHLARGAGEVAERSDAGEGSELRKTLTLGASRLDLSRKRAR
jgi:hypothetical protein